MLLPRKLIHAFDTSAITHTQSHDLTAVTKIATVWHVNCIVLTVGSKPYVSFVCTIACVCRQTLSVQVPLYSLVRQVLSATTECSLPLALQPATTFTTA